MLTSLPKPAPLAPIDKGLQTYSDLIWAEHCRRRGSDFPLMNSVEFSLVLSWWEAKIPFRVILRAMTDTKAAAPRLRYYGPSVAEAFSVWQRATA